MKDWHIKSLFFLKIFSVYKTQGSLIQSITLHLSLDLYQSSHDILKAVTHHYVQHIYLLLHNTHTSAYGAIWRAENKRTQWCKITVGISCSTGSSGVRLPLRFWKLCLYQEQQTEKAICFVTQRHAWLRWIIALQLWKELFSFYLMKVFRGRRTSTCALFAL